MPSATWPNWPYQAPLGAAPSAMANDLLDAVQGAGTFAKLQAMVTALAGAKATIPVTATIDVTSNYTVPSNVTLRMERAGAFQVETGVTLTINGPFRADCEQVFVIVGTGAVVFAAGAAWEFYPEWWGADNLGSADSAAAFNAALTASAAIRGYVVARGPTYKWSSTVTVPIHGKLFLGDSTIIQGADVHLCRVKPWGRVVEGNFDTTGGAFTHACTWFSGSDHFSATSGRHAIIGTRFNGSSGTGTGRAVFLDAEDPTSGFVYGVCGTELRINGYEYGISIFVGGSAPNSNFVNGNRFENVWGNNVVNFIKLEKSGGTQGQDTDGNLFIGMDVETGANSSRALFCQGRYNQVQLMIWDWTGPTSIELPAGSMNNIIVTDHDVAQGVLDNGTLNIIESGLTANLKLATLNASGAVAAGGNVTSGGFFVGPNTGMELRTLDASTRLKVSSGGVWFAIANNPGNYLEWYFQNQDATQAIEVNWFLGASMIDRLHIINAPNNYTIQVTRQTAAGILKPLAFNVMDVPGGTSIKTMQMQTTGDWIMFTRNLTPDSGSKGGVGIRVKAGVPTDADFTNPVDGLLCVDSTDGRIYLRYGGAWHYAALT